MSAAQQKGAARLAASAPVNQQHHHRTTPTTPAELLDRALPHDPEAEAAVLASLLLDPSRAESVLLTLQADDFSLPVNRAIFDAMVRLHTAGKPIDATLLVGVLSDAGQLDRLGDADGVLIADLTGLFELLPTAAHWRFFVGRVLEVSRRRRAVLRGMNLIQAANNAGADLRPASAIERATKHAVEHRTRQARKGVR